MDSLSKNKIKWIRSLRLKKNRDREQCFVLEGEKMVLEVLSEQPENVLCLCVERDPPEFAGEMYTVSHQIMKEISSFVTPHKYLAVVRMPQFEEKNDNLVLVVDSVQDPGNMGTILRTADWFGVDRVVCSRETVDVFNPKVIQSTMGSVFRVPVEYTDLAHYLAGSTLPVYGALLEGASMYEYHFKGRGILVVGNEGKGIDPGLHQYINHPVHIPGKGGAESLNVAVATGILLSAFCKPDAS